MTKRGLQRLAREVRDRRSSLGFAQGDLAARGGPSIVTVGKIERAQLERIQPVTLARLDASLSWESGSSARVLEGGQPKEINSDDHPEPTIPASAGSVTAADLFAAIDRAGDLLPEAKAHLKNQVELLLRLQAAGAAPPELVSEQERRRQEAAVHAEGAARLTAVANSDPPARSGKSKGPTKTVAKRLTPRIR